MERVVKDYAWVDLAPGLQARLHALDACSDLPSLRRFQGDLTPGQLVKATVLQVLSDQLLSAATSRMTDHAGLGSDTCWPRLLTDPAGGTAKMLSCWLAQLLMAG